MKKKELEEYDDIEFCRIDEDELEGTEDYIKYLWSIIFHPSCYYSDFTDDIHIADVKRHVDYVGSLHIVIQSDEHSPPHFEVMIDNSKACFRIDDGTHFKGEMDGRDIKKIQKWYQRKGSKKLLIDKWNESRPYGCEVGEYRGTMPENGG